MTPTTPPVRALFLNLRRGAYGRLISAAGVLAAVIIVGVASYYAVGEGRWSWFDCFYMTIITLSTVGFAETLEGMNELPEARAVTIALIVLGSGTTGRHIAAELRAVGVPFVVIDRDGARLEERFSPKFRRNDARLKVLTASDAWLG